MTALGIDIGASAVKAAAIDPAGRLHVATSRRYHNPSLDQLRRALRATLDALPLDPAPADAVGICAPGIADPTGVITRACNLPALQGHAPTELLPAALPAHVPVVSSSDAHAAAIDFAHTHALTGRLLAISIGTGVGAAVLDDGAPLLVSANTPGHLGHIDVSLSDDPPADDAGAAGTLEAYCSARALLRRLGDPLPHRLDPNDPAIAALARAIRIAHAIYRPDHVALLGGVGVRLRPNLHDIRARVDHRCTPLARPHWTLHAGDHDHHAAAGAARLALRYAAGSTRAP